MQTHRDIVPFVLATLHGPSPGATESDNTDVYPFHYEWRKGSMRRFIMALLTLAVRISRDVGWPPQSTCATATLTSTSRYKIVNENSAFILGIVPPSLTANSMMLSWDNNDTADHRRQSTSVGRSYDLIPQPLIGLFL